MKKFRKIIGIIIILAVLIGLFIFTAQTEGLIEAITGWGVAIGLTGLFIGGVYLVTMD